MRTGLIGVKDLRWQRFSKRDLLLCDQIAVPDLETVLSSLQDRSTIADLEWLAANNVIFDVPFNAALRDMQADHPVAHDLVTISATLMIIAGLIIPEVGEGRIDRNAQLRLLRTGVQGFCDYSARLAARHLETRLGIRTVPYLLSEPSEVSWDVRRNLKEIARRVVSILDDDSIRSAAERYEKPEDRELIAAMPFVFGKTVLRTLDHSVEQLMAGEAITDVAQVVLSALPVPSDAVPLEELLEFVNTSEARDDAIRLRRWMSKVARGSLSELELAEELEFLLVSYREHLDAARCATAIASLDVLLTVPFEIAERLVKVQWSKIPSSILSLRRHRLALMEAERSAPGRELAFIAKAQERFKPQ